MKVRITRSIGLKTETIEGELISFDPKSVPSWELAEKGLEETVRGCGTLAVLVDVPDVGLVPWASSRVQSCRKRECGGWLIQTTSSLFTVIEMAPDAEPSRIRRSTGLVPILALPSDRSS